MKTTSYIVAFTLCAVANLMAADPTQLNQNSGDARLKFKSVLTANPFAPGKETIKDENKIERVGGMSSQPWSQIAVQNSRPSTLTDVQNQETEFPVIWFGTAPQP